ncbi:VgrG protein [Caballeronia glathei]|uniref:Type VI secretion protein Vgr n=1 Tax=Caballeronia glathei TaxID=60547 RepID=A0A069PMK0_9BURK|nr:type VI secretion system Vgr family protein [Caballeronia glathei]KDR38526.1 type VI secretion protein Vgr [Caballeronia glathei]CDY76720.1 VgrG protein [Caballeronia glathei]
MGSMILPTQAYSLRLAKQPALFSVLSFEGREAISETYRFGIEFTSACAGVPVAEVLGKPARFAIEPVDANAGLPAELVARLAKAPVRLFNGIVTAFDELGSSADETRYRVVLEPRLSDLKLEFASRLFQNQTVPSIIEAVLRHYGYTAVDFQFKLRAGYESREYTTQYNESALAFIKRIAADEGIWFRFEQTAEREVIVFGDDLDAYAREPKLTAPYREEGGMASPGVESVMSLSEHRTRVVQSITVDDYNHRTAGVALLTEVNAARDDATTGGKQYRWGGHYPTPEAGKRVATLRHQAELARQVVFEGTGNVIGMTPGAVFRFSNRKLDTAEHGLLLTTVIHKASRHEAYACAFSAIPSDRIYRAMVDPAARPRITGILPARVMSPDNYKYAYLTPQGWYRIQLPFDLDTWSPGGTSRPVRLAKPYAGRDYGHHYPLIDGTEVAVIHTEGDPDRPVIIGALHDSQHQDHVNNENHTRNIIRTAGKNELRMEDREGAEHVHLRTPFQTSELNLGQMVDGQREKRGEGAELRTDGHAAVRAAKGILISADAQTKASGPQLDMAAAKTQLEAALAQMQALADTARVAQAQMVEVDKQREFLERRLDQLQQAVLVASAPAGMALTSGHHLQLAAQGNLTASAGGSADIGVLRKFTVAAGEAISLFAQKLGVKLIAAKGKVEIQAQSDEMTLAALKDVTITSTEGKLVLAAEKEVWIGAGGSYIRITPQGIENGTPGDILEKCAAWNRPGPASMRVRAPTFARIPDTKQFSQKFDLSQFIAHDPASKENWAGVEYEIRNAQGKLLRAGTTNEDGITDRVFTDKSETVTAFIGGGEWGVVEEFEVSDEDIDPESET